ncbi:T9SS type A sorting domain-containing protein [Owenweeksia hongkongensis]|uniref:T9SS type A sorting domain-containing protein n=1 Tax=Owenweeksia hongkongensis TaxID=253245 RepID=UPI003A904D4B
MLRLLFFFCLSSTLMFAQQIPNAGFENWHVVPNTNGKEDPDHWESTNRLLSSNLSEGVSKSSDANSGNYAVKLTPSLEAGKYTQLVLGKLSLDSAGNSTYRKCPGQAVSHLPLVVKGYYKFLQAQQNVHAGISVIFTSGCYNDVYVYFVFGNDAFDPTPNEYKPFAVPIEFHGGSFSDLDTMMISIQIAGPDTNATSSFLLIDDVSILGEYVGVDESNHSPETVQLFPNPTSGNVTIESFATDPFTVKVYSLHGKLLFEDYAIMESQYQLDLIGPAGVYFVEVTSSEGNRVFKVLKE